LIRIASAGKPNEHPLETYRRIAGLTQDQLNAQPGEYAQHQVTYDCSNTSHFMPFIRNVYGAGFINADNGVPVDAVGGHYAIPDALAPSDYGYNKIKLVPSSDGALVKLHFKGHVNRAAGSGWDYSFVAVKNGVRRYGLVVSGSDGQISFQLQPGESELYLVMVGAPARCTTTPSSTASQPPPHRHPARSRQGRSLVDRHAPEGRNQDRQQHGDRGHRAAADRDGRRPERRDENGRR
jgi:hypothetical protein